jgi:hypothetical protein
MNLYNSWQRSFSTLLVELATIIHNFRDRRLQGVLAAKNSLNFFYPVVQVLALQAA